MNELTLQNINLQPGNYVLEIGFGGGYLLEKILTTKIPEFIAAIDPSIDVIKIGKKRFSQQITRGYLEIKQGNAENLPYGDRVFDRICTVNTLYFWSDAKSVLNECNRVLKPGGKLVICYNSKEFLEETELTKYGFTAYEVTELELLMENLGFTNVITTSANSLSNGLFHCTSGIKF
ncbi:MAG: hypothetical protein Tsb0014_23690 [Pleurocapsa sp.]